MSFTLTYQAGKESLSCSLSNADWDTIEALRAHLLTHIATCFDVREIGQSLTVEAAAVKQSSLEIDHFLAKNAAMLPATYQFKLETFPIPGANLGWNASGISGIRLPHDREHFYMLRAGLNKLCLGRIEVGPDGNGVVSDEHDLRAQTELVTETYGIIQFRRRAAKTTLRRTLREIAAFADGVTASCLTKTVV